MKKLISILIFLLFIISVHANGIGDNQYVCPSVCVPLYDKSNNCVLNSCGSGCGADNINTFKTELECKSKITQPIIMPIQDETIDQDEQDAGVLPTSRFYKIELFFERMQERFSEKAKFRNARERISEIRVMVKKQNYEKALVAKARYDEIYLRLNENQKKVEEVNKEFIQNLGTQVSQIASDGKLEDFEREQIKTLIANHKVGIRDKVATQTDEERKVLREEIEKFNPEQEMDVEALKRDMKCSEIKIIENDCVKLIERGTYQRTQIYKNTCDKIVMSRVDCIQ